MAHIRQSRPDSGLGLHVKVLQPFQVVSASLGSGPCLSCRLPGNLSRATCSCSRRYSWRIAPDSFRISDANLVSSSGFRVSGFEFRVSGFKFRGSGFDSRVQGNIQGFGCRASLHISDVNLRASHSGCRVFANYILDIGFIFYTVFRIWGFGACLLPHLRGGESGLGLRLHGVWIRVQGSWFRLRGSWVVVRGSGFRVQGSVGWREDLWLSRSF